MQERYCYQKYLLLQPHDLIQLNTITVSRDCLDSIQDYQESRNLLDYVDGYKRKISLQELDDVARDKSDFDKIVRRVANVDELWLITDRAQSDNPILESHANATERSYVYLFKTSHVNVVSVVVQ